MCCRTCKAREHNLRSLQEVGSRLSLNQNRRSRAGDSRLSPTPTHPDRYGSEESPYLPIWIFAVKKQIFPLKNKHAKLVS